MDIIKQALKWIGVGFLAVVIVGGIIMGMDYYTKAQDKTTKQLAKVDELTYTVFDGTSTSGSSIVEFITTDLATLKRDDVQVFVKNGKGNVSVYGGATSTITTDVTIPTGFAGGSAATYKKSLSSSSTNYIKPSATFIGTVERDANGIIRAVFFEQEQ